MDWWFDPDDYNPPPKEEKKSENDIAWTQKVCYHDWKPTILIVSTVYDCTKCGIKKEDYEKWQKST